MLRKLIDPRKIATDVITATITKIVSGLINNGPEEMIDSVHNQVTVRMRLSTIGWQTNSLYFYAFLDWFQKNNERDVARSFIVDVVRDENWENKEVIHPSHSKNVFYFKGKKFWYNRFTQEARGKENPPEYIDIYTYGRNPKLMHQLLDEFRPKKDKREFIQNYGWDEGWKNPIRIPPRPLNTIAIDPAVLNGILADIEEFKSSREWYIRTGIPYKLVIMLYGPPGTGKTSLVRAIASHIKADVHSLNPTGMTEYGLFSAFSSVSEGNIILMDDFNADGGFGVAKGMEEEAKKENEERRREMGDKAPPAKDAAVKSEQKTVSLFGDMDVSSMHGLLTAIDGVVPIDNVIIFMCSNDIEGIDPRLKRPGRIDREHYIGPVIHDDIVSYIERMWNQKVPTNIRFAPISGAKLSNRFSRHRYDFDAFINSIPKAAYDA